jgi:hypothetical protein
MRFVPGRCQLRGRTLFAVVATVLYVSPALGSEPTAEGRGDRRDEAFAGAQAAAIPANVFVNFAVGLQHVRPLAIGVDETGYGDNDTALPSDANERAAIAQLGPKQMRMYLRFLTPGNASGAVVCGQAFCSGGTNAVVTGEQYVAAIRETGAEPIVQIPIYPKRPDLPLADAIALSASDAEAMVRRFNAPASSVRVGRWLIHNEPDGNGIPKEEYWQYFNEMTRRMKRADGTIRVGGPQTAFYNTAYLEEFLGHSCDVADIVDFHSYGQGGSVVLAPEQLLAQTVKYQNNLRDLRARIGRIPLCAGRDLELQIGEFNLDWDGDPKYFQQFNTVWAASALGHILKGGGNALAYGTKNGALGFVCDAANCRGADPAYAGQPVDTPRPIYWGFGLYLGGEGLGIGDLWPTTQPTWLVESWTGLNGVEVYPFQNAVYSNLVVVNKNSVAVTASFSVSGLRSSNGQVFVFTKDGSQPPWATPSGEDVCLANGGFAVNLPPLSAARVFFVPGQ